MVPTDDGQGVEPATVLEVLEVRAPGRQARRRVRAQTRNGLVVECEALAALTPEQAVQTSAWLWQDCTHGRR